MVLDAMQAVQAEGVAMCDAHPDLEVFRLRLGKALNYEYNEDTQTGLFQRRDPREGEVESIRYCHTSIEASTGGPALDIERGEPPTACLDIRGSYLVPSLEQTGEGRAQSRSKEGKTSHTSH